ncbi:MAG TPA: rhomboid family intramembrane serine protease [Acidimicrobiales bacterium]|nr:rhomboid family intramembrane serine protease [Acidimicrobiales bacterium]
MRSGPKLPAVLPLKDYNPTKRFPVVTLVLIAINVGVYFFVQRPFDEGTSQAAFTYEVAAIPCEVVQGRPLSEDEVVRTIRLNDDTACEERTPEDPAVFPDKSVWLALVYSMFLHGGLLHLGGNMLFLWIFGNNIEDRMRIPGYIGFYLLAGLAASAAHILVQPDSTVPVVGASGAIAGVMGAYLVLFPNVKIRSLIILIIIVLFRDIPAKWLLGAWFVLQFFTSPDEGVAWVAHVGGFVFGALVALFLRERLRPSRVDLDPEPSPTPTW